MKVPFMSYLNLKALLVLAISIAFMSNAYADLPAPGSENLTLSTTDTDKLLSVIELVDNGAIHQNMKLTEVENLFQRKRAEGFPSPGSLNWFVVPLSSSRRTWQIIFDYDELGVVKYYTLTNFETKLGPIYRTAPTQAEIDKVATAYKNATTDGERLNICITAINTALIGTEVPISNISKICGQSWISEAPINGLKTYSVPLSRCSNGWRLFFSVQGNFVDQYYLSKIRPAQTNK